MLIHSRTPLLCCRINTGSLFSKEAIDIIVWYTNKRATNASPGTNGRRKPAFESGNATTFLVRIYLGASLCFSLLGCLQASPDRVVLPVAFAAAKKYLWQMSLATSGQTVMFTAMCLGGGMLFSCCHPNRVVSFMILATCANIFWRKIDRLDRGALKVVKVSFLV